MKQSKWNQLSLIEQLSHVGAEVHRALHWEQKKDTASRNNCLERAINLIDSILGGANLKHRTREIARLREVICDNYAGENENHASLSMLDNYFMPLTVCVRNRKSHV